MPMGWGWVPVSIEPPAAVHVIERDAPVKDEPPPFSFPYMKVHLEKGSINSITLHEASDSDLGNLIDQVVTAEAPVHISEVIRRLMDVYGVKKQAPGLQPEFKRPQSIFQANRNYASATNFCTPRMVLLFESAIAQS